MNLLSLDEDSLFALGLGAQACYYLKEHKRALGLAARALKFEPGYVEMLGVTAASQAALGNVAAALEVARQLLRANAAASPSKRSFTFIDTDAEPRRWVEWGREFVGAP